MSDKRIVSMAVELRNESDEFTGRESPDDVVEAILEQRLSKLTEEEQKAEEKQSELREKFGIDSGDGDTEELTEAEQKRQELRERFQP